MARRIFLSYSSPDADAAARIELSLESDGHDVFRDRADLPPGESYDARIRTALANSDLLIFLISPASVSKGHYTLTELQLAQEQWPSPSGHLLPVLVQATPMADIPQYLRAVTFLEPKGDVAAEVSAAVARMDAPVRRKRGTWLAFAAAAIVLFAVLAGVGWRFATQAAARREEARRVTALLQQERLLTDAGNYAAAWTLLEKDATLASAPAVVAEQEALAMTWLDNARGSQIDGTLRSIADRVSPVLARGAAAGSGRHAADLLAHLGWAGFLRSREGVGGLDPVQSYRHALEIDPANAYAHAMWGFDILRTGGPLVEARKHFDAALASADRRDYVRHMQVSGLLWDSDSTREEEAIRVANAVRKSGDAMPRGLADRTDADRLWNVYYRRLVSGADERAFLDALPGPDHVATFRWLYPEDSKDRRLSLFMLGRLQDHAQDRASALSTYRALLETLKQRGEGGGMVYDTAKEAIARLSR